MEIFSVGIRSSSISDPCGHSLTSVGIAELENNIILDVHKCLLDIVKLYQCSLFSKIRKINLPKCIFKRNLLR